MGARAVVLAVALVLAPLSAKAADLVVWWEKGFYPQEDQAVREIVAAFEQGSGKQVEIAFHSHDKLLDEIERALEIGRPPDFVFGLDLLEGKWAFEDRLLDLSDVIGHFSDLFDPRALDRGLLLNANTGQKGLYGLPVGVAANYIHVWKNLLELAGFTVQDIPREWDAFWSFWCDQGQPAVRQATGRNDVWGIGLPMSVQAWDTWFELSQFLTVYEADYVTPDGRLIIDDPEIRRKLVKAIDRYTAIYRNGCTPPDSISWDDLDNNKRFLDQTVLMTANSTLSIPNALKPDRPDDYANNTATIEWPLGPHGEPFPITAEVELAVVFKGGSHVGNAGEFVRFLVRDGWLAHYLNFAGERFLPPIPKLLDQPFWLDPRDRHRMAAVMQAASRPIAHNYAVASGDWRHDQLLYRDWVWGKAVHRVAAEGISPEQAVDEAIARIKQILSEQPGPAEK